jgi:cell division septation protein DedD
LALLPETPVEAAPPVNTVRESFDGDYPWIDHLNAGAYYVQIAAYKDAVNVRTILNRFGKKYPVVVQKGASSDKPLVKVYVGPLKKDEYGAVLEYFRKNGFPDAFARNIP